MQESFVKAHIYLKIKVIDLVKKKGEKKLTATDNQLISPQQPIFKASDVVNSVRAR